MQPIIPRQFGGVKITELAAPEYQFRCDTPFPEGREETLLKFPLPEINAQDEELAPEPACLGDLIKLFCGPRILWEFYPSLDADDSDLEKYTAFPATEIIAQSNPFSTIFPAKKTWIKVDYPENWRIISPFLDTRVSIAQTRKVDSVQMIKINTQAEQLELLGEVTSMTRVVWSSSMLGELHEIVLSTDTPDEQLSSEIRNGSQVPAFMVAFTAHLGVGRKWGSRSVPSTNWIYKLPRSGSTILSVSRH